MTADRSQIVIVGAARTPMGRFLGDLSPLSAPRLGAAAIKAACLRAKADINEIDEVIMGCVLPAGLGQAPARQAALLAGLPNTVGCTTINKMCGSGMKALMLANDALIAGSARMVLAGGMESMSNAPYLIARARTGLRMGHASLTDHMFIDGLEDAYDKGRLMGAFAEDTAEKYGLSRQDQDAFAIESLKRARKAASDGSFALEIAPASVNGKIISQDQPPAQVDLQKIKNLKPAFREGGTITAANASSLADGAAALILTTRKEAEKQGLSPIAGVKASAFHAQAPSSFATAPAFAIAKVLDKASWSQEEVGLFEINEAFAVVVMAAMADMALPHDKVNVFGGACALGHPLGASGARIIVTLLNALRQRGLRKGVAALCIGGGEATAMALELA